MVKFERRVLKTILKLTDNLNDVIYYNPASYQFQVAKVNKSISSPVKYCAKDMRALLCSLESKDFVNVFNQPDEILFTITFQGKHHLDYSFERFKEFFFSRFVDGVITGVVTTLLAQYLLHLLRL